MNKIINAITSEDIDNFISNPTLNAYQIAATKSAIYPGKGTPRGMSYVLHKLAGEAGEANEHFGKAQRDDGFGEPVIGYIGGGMTRDAEVYIHYPKQLTEERREFLLKEIGDCLWYLSALCNELGTTLTKVALMNLKKLSGRARRGTLQGSGDNR